jgi:hypothetical protein
MTKWNGLSRNNPPAKTSKEVLDRNKEWKKLVLARAFQLREKYGRIVCEYSGETIFTLSSVPHTFQEGWGHHRDSNRENCSPENIYLCKYIYHQKIERELIKTEQEDFQGCDPDNIPRPQYIQVEDL